jgi:hypothetical protein
VYFPNLLTLKFRFEAIKKRYNACFGIISLKEPITY